MLREWTKSKRSCSRSQPVRGHCRWSEWGHGCGGVYAGSTYLLERPIPFEIVDLEADIWHDPVRLDGAQIDADDLGGREHLADIQRPDAGAGAAVEDVLRLVGDRGDEQRAAQREQLQVVVHI